MPLGREAPGHPVGTVTGTFAFADPATLVVDEETGLLRSVSRERDVPVEEQTHDLRSCQVRDCSTLGIRPDLERHGFAHVELGGVDGLMPILERVRRRARLGDADARAIRRKLVGSSLALASGARIRLLFIAGEGFIMRRSGPGGVRMDPAAAPVDTIHQDAARVVHVDQDVDGTPLRQILRGAAPWLFHHDSPLHANTRSPLFLVNIWVPLDQVTMPLALLDRRTFRRREHQLRYGLPTDAFLQRKVDRRVNDIWALLHHPDQEWYFTSDMPLGRAYVFETLSTAHVSFSLPGEDRAASLRRRLEGMLAGGDPGPDAVPGTEPRTAPLRAAIDDMERLLEEGPGASDWPDRARAATSRVVRKSLEMRVVGLVTGR